MTKFKTLNGLLLVAVFLIAVSFINPPISNSEKLAELIEKYENYDSYDHKKYPLGLYTPERYQKEADFAAEVAAAVGG